MDEESDPARMIVHMPGNDLLKRTSSRARWRWTTARHRPVPGRIDRRICSGYCSRSSRPVAGSCGGQVCRCSNEPCARAIAASGGVLTSSWSRERSGMIGLQASRARLHSVGISRCNANACGCARAFARNPSSFAVNQHTIHDGHISDRHCARCKMLSHDASTTT